MKAYKILIPSTSSEKESFIEMTTDDRLLLTDPLTGRISACSVLSLCHAAALRFHFIESDNWIK
jgi:hypothetical protein